MTTKVEWKHKPVMGDDGNIISTSFVAVVEGLHSAQVLMGLTGNGDVQVQVFTTGETSPIFQKTFKYNPDTHTITISEVEWKHEPVMGDDGNIISTSFVAVAQGIHCDRVLMGLTGNGDVQVQVVKTGETSPIFQTTFKYNPDTHTITISD